MRHPTIEILPPPSWEPLDEALGRLHEYDWLLFTSAAAARFTLDRFPPAMDLKSMTRPQLAAVGFETAHTIEARGLKVALIPEQQQQEGLMAAFEDLRPGLRILFPQALGGREDLRNALHRRGCTVDVVPASQTIPRRDLPPVPEFDLATFASPSALRAFVAAHGTSPLENRTVGTIGPTTAAAARALGLSPVVAETPTVAGLIDALKQVV
jgi:uroporphyrinogen III methyltransferase/synthase